VRVDKTANRFHSFFLDFTGAPIQFFSTFAKGAGDGVVHAIAEKGFGVLLIDLGDGAFE